PDELDELDRWILHRTQKLLARCREAYENFEFHVVYHALNNFCSVDLSALYLDIVKDRLYCEGARSKGRRSAQTTLHRTLEVLTHLLAPILSFTAEEIWEHMPKKSDAPQSVFLSGVPEPDLGLIDEELERKWDQIFKERGEVLKALEGARNAGIIGHSLDARVEFYFDSGGANCSLRELFSRDEQKAEDVLIISQGKFVSEGRFDFLEQSRTARQGGERGTQVIVCRSNGSQVCVYDSEILNGYIAVTKAGGQKCERCWKYDEEVKKPVMVCPRCSAVLDPGVPA
ncbi:MAG: class I tRNA ligase family protein, partial [Deltaproteobacteria bacterium]|nr:class I tRNA ligase family protein [Deltaproteobacteria bacterium]